MKRIRMVLDYKKCLKTIETCETYHHSVGACHLVAAFGSTYSFNSRWSKLDELAKARYFGWLDKFEYEGTL